MGGERLAEVNQALEGEKSERLADMDANNKRIQQQISHCGANVEQERQGRERDTRRLEEALHAQQDESHAMLQRVRQEMERSIDVEAQSTRERFAEPKQR